MYCKTCRKNVRSIAHWAREHRELFRKRRKKVKGRRREKSILELTRSLDKLLRKYR